VLYTLICGLCRRLAYQIFMGEETEGLEERDKRGKERKGKGEQDKKVCFLPGIQKYE